MGLFLELARGRVSYVPAPDKVVRLLDLLGILTPSPVPTSCAVKLSIYWLILVPTFTMGRD